jgi:hypothetical protein
MTNEQALQVIKKVLDAAAKSGLFENMEASFLAANSFNLISRAIIKEDKKEDDANGTNN